MTPDSRGTVTQWSDDEGWGVIESKDTPGGCWAHYSVVVGSGYRSLVAGLVVPFSWEACEQDGFHFRASRVGSIEPGRTAGADVRSGPSPAYRSTLTIRHNNDDSP